MIKKTTLAISTIVLLSGCAHQSDYQGQGEYFELAKTNVVERDLTTPFIQPSIAELAKTIPPKPIKINPKSQGSIRGGETYEHALTRWLNKQGYQYIAWSVDSQTLKLLKQRSPKTLTLTGSLFSRVAQVGIHLEEPIQLTTAHHNVAAIHQFKTPTTLVLAHGHTLKDAVKNIVHDYHGKWDDQNSYQASDDYAFTTSYPIITKQDDITTALNSLLYGYPVQAKILQSTNQVFIEDHK
ncbi:hypothetical protein [Vibrio algicola]|uniref:hypothetical protein n=1 Tax=Vibrio algicola TaxID=2662262 RepID=UPI0015B597E9|nr:hypothetical protein [Vibrio algicola]